jgi:hypothetical protein
MIGTECTGSCKSNYDLDHNGPFNITRFARHNISEILLKVALNTITLIPMILLQDITMFELS